jgi:hypothetical protein
MTTLTFSIWGDGSSAFWTMMGFLALVFSFYFLIKQIKIQNSANMMSFINVTESKWRSDEFVEIRKKVCAKQTNRIDKEEETLLSFFEDLGILYKRRIVDIDIIWEKFSYYIENYWQILEPNIIEFQKESNDSTWFQNFENLYSETIKYSAKKTNNKKYSISREKNLKFRQSEIS